jgi:hypothetical protein
MAPFRHVPVLQLGTGNRFSPSDLELRVRVRCEGMTIALVRSRRTAQPEAICDAAKYSKKK